MEATNNQQETQDQKDERFIEESSESLIDSINTLLEEIVSDESSEIIMNGPHQIFKKEHGFRKHINVDFGDVETYHNVINHCILKFTDTADRLNEGKTLIEGQISISVSDDEPPLMARCHVVGPPTTKPAKVTIAKKSRTSVSVEDMVRSGSLSRDMAAFLKASVQGKATIVLSGVSGSGKTTLLEALSVYFDPQDRVIVVEDTPELNIPVQDTVNLYAHKRRPGESADAEISLEWLVAQTNRMRPDRIIVGEARGAEFAEFLLAANSGADGSMTTLHANDPSGALSKMLSLASMRGVQSEASINRDIAATVQIVVQAALINERHVITHIEEVSPIIRQSTNTIATTTLYQYNRLTQKHERKNSPSEQYLRYLESRGVSLRLNR